MLRARCSRIRLRRASGQRGAVVVEAAFILPIMILLMMGIIEFGLLLSAKNVVTNAAGTAARVASALPRNNSFATEAHDKAAAQLDNNHQLHNGDLVVVYEAKDDGTPKYGGSPPSCSRNCVKYTYNGGGWTTGGAGWSAANQDACPLQGDPLSWDSTTDTRTWIGVYVQIPFDGRQIPFSGVLMPDEVHHQVVYRLEPVPTQIVPCRP